MAAASARPGEQHLTEVCQPARLKGEEEQSPSAQQCLAARRALGSAPAKVSETGGVQQLTTDMSTQRHNRFVL